MIYPFTSGRLEISTSICFITSEGTGTFCSSGKIKSCIFPCFWHSSHLFTYSPSASILWQKYRSAHFDMLSLFSDVMPSLWIYSYHLLYTLTNVMDNLLPFLFGFNNKPLVFVHKISTDDSKVFASHFQAFLFSLISLREKRFWYEETVSTSALLSNTRNQDLEYIFSVLFFSWRAVIWYYAQIETNIWICSSQTPQSLPTLCDVPFSLVKSPKRLH